MFVHGIAGHIFVTRYRRIGRTSTVAFLAERLEVYKVKYGTSRFLQCWVLKVLSYGVLKLLIW